MSSIEKYRERVRSIEKTPEFLLEQVKLAFADDLCRLMEQQGISRGELAKRIGVSRSYITRILNTEYNLTAETMVKLALALGARVSLHLHSADVYADWTEVPARQAHAARRNDYIPYDRPDLPIVADKPATYSARRTKRNAPAQ